jgi:hypothetical protein
MANDKRDPKNGRNTCEELAHRFGLSNADCVADPRLARLINYKALLDERIRVAQAANVRPLGRAAGFTDQELDGLDQHVLWLLKGIRDAQRHLAILSPKKRNATPTKEKK